MNIHFIGIGGIGVSALAQYYLEKRETITGSDLKDSEIINLLREKGAKIFIGEHKSDNLPENTDLVIYSPAIQKNNPELKKALALQVSSYKLQVLSYPQALGKLTKKHFTIAVSGTHGKSTTSSMLALILIKAGLDPTVIIGTKLKEFDDSNFRAGKSKYLLIEADEWQASFLNYYPQIIILTNIEKEHLDYYKNLNHILRTYKEYISHLPKEGILIINGKDKNIKKLIFNFQFPIFNFQKEEPKDKKTLKKILKVPGEHNIENALAALETARILGISDDISFSALSDYQGAWRRFEESNHSFKNHKLQTINYKLISDYAHHPTEILATLKAARGKFKNEKIWLVFQPHQYQRVFHLLLKFVSTFQKIKDMGLADKIIITDIFDVSGREDEKIKKKINSKKLVRKIKNNSIIYLEKENLISQLKEELKNKKIDVLIMMGAGDIYELTKKLSPI